MNNGYLKPNRKYVKYHCKGGQHRILCSYYLTEIQNYIHQKKKKAQNSIEEVHQKPGKVGLLKRIRRKPMKDTEFN